ncbi:hypothetical protein WJX84_005268 [Apatococcus fuscideae]|uniref:Aminotransferase class V domain-containing protein n=1 Tax=Apatococcus fuscideae TaxID=2026836 RepID=A0AAW1RVD0_9CHLO
MLLPSLLPGVGLAGHGSSHTRTSLAQAGTRRLHDNRLQASTLERASTPPASGSRLGEALRQDFPVLHQQVNGQPLIYFDNAATSQKPLQVLQAMEDYYKQSNSNVHRGVHHLAGKATAAYEAAREKLAAFIGARSSREVVWTKNATEGINLVAYSWGMSNLKAGDEILCSVAEHHSNLYLGSWWLSAQELPCGMSLSRRTHRKLTWRLFIP